MAIAIGTVCYLIFYYVPQLDTLGDELGDIVDVIFPWMVFSTLFSTFCRIDFHQMRPHRWHVGVIVTQLVLIALNVWLIMCVEGDLGPAHQRHADAHDDGIQPFDDLSLRYLDQTAVSERPHHRS